MRLKVLMVGNSEGANADAEMLRDRGFLVYTCSETTVNEMVEEVHPAVIFLNPEDSNNSKSIDVYNALLGNIFYTNYPVIYTMSEDDVYIVNRKRTSSKDKRTVISDNIVDSIKVALLGTQIAPKEHAVVDKQHMPLHYHHARRA